MEEGRTNVYSSQPRLGLLPSPRRSWVLKSAQENPKHTQEPRAADVEPDERGEKVGSIFYVLFFKKKK